MPWKGHGYGLPKVEMETLRSGVHPLKFPWSTLQRRKENTVQDIGVQKQN
jgi:hypothetical protein